MTRLYDRAEQERLVAAMNREVRQFTISVGLVIAAVVAVLWWVW